MAVDIGTIPEIIALYSCRHREVDFILCFCDSTVQKVNKPSLCFCEMESLIFCGLHIHCLHDLENSIK